MQNHLAISECPFASVSKRVLVQNLSYENEFDLHENEPVGEHIIKSKICMTMNM